jgi:thiamine-phosphate pyrophosphorylase
MLKIKNYNLYLVISEEYGLGKNALEIARLAISGGVDIIQMREKNRPRNDPVELGSEFSKLCKENRVTFIVNDDPLIAKECGACGVHLGQEDMLKYSITETRNIIGKEKIIGVSTHSLPELIKANEEKDVDYIAYGPIFPTKTKNYFLGDNDIQEAVRITKKPLFFIGGINLSNLDVILEKGGKNIAMIRDILQSEDITAQARSFKQKLIKKAGKIIIKINGKEETIETKIDLAELITNENLSPGRIVIEYNFRVLKKEEWQKIILHEGDNIEIISFLGGG